MAHKTLVNSTAYDITGGKTLVDGTSYSVNNGKVLIDGTEHDISFLLPPGALDVWSGIKANYDSINCAIYANGYWVVGGQHVEGTTVYGRIAYATNPSGPWTITDIWGGEVDTSVNAIAYADGYWVVCGVYQNFAGMNWAKYAYTTSLDRDWTSVDLWNGGSNYKAANAKCIAYGNGYWVVGGNAFDSNDNSYSAVINYFTDIRYGGTTEILWFGTGSNTAVNGIVYGNGYWMAVGGHGDTGNSAIYAFTTDPTDYWSVNALYASSVYTRATCVTYANGYFVVGGVYASKTTSYNARISYATSPDGTWTTKNLWHGSDNSADPRIHSIAHGGGYWVVSGMYNDGTEYHARIVYTTDLAGTWTTLDLWSGSYGNGNGPAKCITYGDGYWVVGGQQHYIGIICNAHLEYSPSLEGFNDIGGGGG